MGRYSTFFRGLIVLTGTGTGTGAPTGGWFALFSDILLSKYIQLWDYGVFWRRWEGQIVRAGTGRHFSGGGGRAECWFFLKIGKKNGNSHPRQGTAFCTVGLVGHRSAWYLPVMSFYMPLTCLPLFVAMQLILVLIWGRVKFTENRKKKPTKLVKTNT